MDINANLAEQREIAALLLDRTIDTNELERLAERLAELVQAMDDWLSKQGFLPDAWQAKQVQQVQAQANEARNYLNGMSVLGFYNDAVYIRIPHEIAADITHGCACDYCKAHPEITPKWDTLCVDLKPRHAYGHTWTVHMPEYNHLLKGTRTGK